MNINEILQAFGMDLPVHEFGNGHINSTYAVGEPAAFVLQKINTTVFTDPDGLMQNVVDITSHLRTEIAKRKGDVDRETLFFFPTKEGKPYFRTPEGECWRLSRMISGANSYDVAQTPELFAEAAHGFGNFQKMLSSFPAEKLKETIPHFHDTPNRIRQFRETVAKNRSGRAEAVANEIAFVLDRAENTSKIVEGLADGSIPLRVTHNDTKLNNVLLDQKTKKALCVIDLDTVMPGSMLYDFGDALRFGASTGAEDEQDLEKISFSLRYFEAYTDAFLQEVGGMIQKRELELLPYSAWLMTLECGARFLADFVDGDRYFKIHRENHNLDRARTQFKLVADMEQKADAMEEIVAACCKKRGL